MLSKVYKKYQFFISKILYISTREIKAERVKPQKREEKRESHIREEE